MIYFLLVLVVLLIIIAFFLFLQNSKIKEQHRQNMGKLHEIISSLHQKQLLLNDKVTIALDYNSNYTKDMKNIGDEVVVLQKVFLEIISNAKNS